MTTPVKRKDLPKTDDLKTTVTPPKLNLWEKIQAVSNEIGNIEKDITIGHGKYAYQAVSDLAVILAVKKAESKYRLISVPYKQKLIKSKTVRIIKKNGDEGLTHVENIKMTTKIIDLDDPSQFTEIHTLAKGIDSGDKGFGKASTYARKYALLNAYKIATGEDPDADKSQELNTPKSISEKRVAVTNYFDLNTSKLPAILKHFNIEDLGDLDEKQVETIYQTYTQKGLIL